MSTPAILKDITCATEVFLATALLHREQPERSDFMIQEIVNRAAEVNMTGEFRSGVNVHASQHCVANRPPNPAKNRMLFATGKHTRRLLLPGDEVHQGRTGRIFPDLDEVPEKYRALLDWARKRYENAVLATHPRQSAPALASGNERKKPVQTSERWLESLFELEGLGKEHWKNTDPDEFVRQLREGWE